MIRAWIAMAAMFGMFAAAMPQLGCLECGAVCEDQVYITVHLPLPVDLAIGASLEVCLNGVCSSTTLSAIAIDPDDAWVQLDGDLTVAAQLSAVGGNAVITVSPTSCVTPTVSCSGQPGAPLGCCMGTLLTDGDRYEITTILDGGALFADDLVATYRHEQDCGNGCMVLETDASP